MNENTDYPAPGHIDESHSQPFAFCQTCGRTPTPESARVVGRSVYCEPCLEARPWRPTQPAPAQPRALLRPSRAHPHGFPKLPERQTPASPRSSASSPASAPCTTSSTPRVSSTSSSSSSSSPSPTPTASSASSSPAGSSTWPSTPTTPHVPAATACRCPTPSGLTTSASGWDSAKPGREIPTPPPQRNKPRGAPPSKPPKPPSHARCSGFCRPGSRPPAR